MNWKTVETVLLAIGALVSAAKWVVKFIGYVSKIKKEKRKLCTA